MALIWPEPVHASSLVAVAAPTRVSRIGLAIDIRLAPEACSEAPERPRVDTTFLNGGRVALERHTPRSHRTLLREVRWRPPKRGSRVPAILAPDGDAPRTWLEKVRGRSGVQRALASAEQRPYLARSAGLPPCRGRRLATRRPPHRTRRLGSTCAACQCRGAVTAADSAHCAVRSRCAGDFCGRVECGHRGEQSTYTQRVRKTAVFVGFLPARLRGRLGV